MPTPSATVTASTALATMQAANHGSGGGGSAPSSTPLVGRVSAGFSLRLATVNVCVLPALTRNKYMIIQLGVGTITTLVALAIAASIYLPFIPLLLRCVLVVLLSMPLQAVVIPLQALVLFILSRGQWHDYKRERLQLLLDGLDELDCVAVQELFSGVMDARHRDWVLREAEIRGFHYSVSLSRFPRWPVLLLNTGTLILSRYPIVDSRNMVFCTTALTDRLTVNRGASWARIQLPTGHTMHLFTCHVAPPLGEVKERIGDTLAALMQCPQQKQLEELVQFIEECTQKDRDEWDADCAAATTSAPLRSRPFSVVLAGDFNLDAGSSRYFWLLNALHKLDLGITDLFAKEEDGGDGGVVVQHREETTTDEDEGSEEEEQTTSSGTDEEEESSASAASAAAASVLPRRRRRGRNHSHPHPPPPPAAAISSSSSSSATIVPALPSTSGAPLGLPSGSPVLSPSAAPSSPSSLPLQKKASSSKKKSRSKANKKQRQRMIVARNQWCDQRGNGRETFDAQAHRDTCTHIHPHLRASAAAVSEEALADSKPTKKISWLPTFGQRLTAPPSLSSVAPSPAAASSSASSSPPARHLETFLTHPSLLGAHVTHDYIFSSLVPRSIRVDPFLAPHARDRMHHITSTEKAAPAAEKHDDDDDPTADLALSEDDPLLANYLADECSDDRPVRTYPPYTQLSDHSALVATLMMPEESERRSRAASLA